MVVRIGAMLASGGLLGAAYGLHPWWPAPIPVLAAALSVSARDHALDAGVRVPGAWAAADTLVAGVSPHGSAGSLAYSQMDALPVIQVAALAGAPGIVAAARAGRRARLRAIQRLVERGARIIVRPETIDTVDAAAPPAPGNRGAA